MLNREPLRTTLRDAIARSRETGMACAVMLLRVRRLREVGVLFGHDVADALMESVAARIAEVLRAGDGCARAGDDSFLLSLPALRDAGHAALAAGKLVRVLQSPTAAGMRKVSPVVDIGIAMCPQHGEDPAALWRFADQACEEARRGSDRFAFYRASDPRAMFSDDDLREAMDANQLNLHLQPILDLASGRLDRCEALARWTHPRLGPVPPEIFVRVAEQTGLIAELTRWSLNVALRGVSANWGGIDPAEAPMISVNVAVDALLLPGFVDQVLDMLRFWAVAPGKLTLEITESALMHDQEQGVRLLQILRDAGVGIAIDDFGTGYSSLAYLHRLPANELKIDKSFVRSMVPDARARALVASIIDVSRHLGMRSVAEGVEDAATLELLRSLGCDHAQGYLIGEPASTGVWLPKLAAQARAHATAASA